MQATAKKLGKCRFFRQPFALLLVFALLLFGSVLPYSVIEEWRQSEETPISSIVYEIKGIHHSEKRVPVRQDRVVEDENLLAEHSLEVFLPPSFVTTCHWLESRQSRAPPYGNIDPA
ncbi:MAG TPA: hypothetical protein V6C99_10410 [Oculatellaceae cyanobacterium]